MRSSRQTFSPKERCRVVQDIGESLVNSPRSGCPETIVGANGNSRYRVKMCWHLRASFDEEEWYRGSVDFNSNVFVSLLK